MIEKIYGKGIVEGYVEGEVMVSKTPLALLGGLNPNTGEIVEDGHELKGKSLAEKILVVYNEKGSTAGIYTLIETIDNKKGPKGVITSRKASSIILAAIQKNLPLIIVEESELGKFKEQDYIKMDATKGIIEIYKNFP